MNEQEKFNLLKSYHFPKQVENLLLPQIKDNTIGLCAAFVGNVGTNKRDLIKEITEFLYKIKKLKSSEIYSLTLAEKNLEFFDENMYSLIKLEKGLNYDKNYYKHCQSHFEVSSSSKINKESRYSYNTGIEILISQYRKKYIIINCEEHELKKFFDEDSRLSYIFSDIIYFRDITNLEIANIVKDNLINKEKIETSEIKKWLEVNRCNIPFENRELGLYIANYMNFHNNEFPKAIMRPDSSQKALDRIIGLDPIKQQIEDLKKYLQFKYKAEKEGVILPSQSLHMLFLGNPGCGKTTVARIVAQILYEIGICKENKLIEVSRKDLIAEYTGQTAPKTQAVIEKSMNGVLFIDEAYSLKLSKDGDTYGSEAIATLIKAMEDNKDKLIVIFAGYENEMQQFIDSNSGIASRIGYTFNFPDFTIEELVEIYKRKMESFTFADGHIKNIKYLLESSYGLKNAGNGRLVDKVIQNVLIKHSKREDAESLTLTKEDVPLTIKNDSSQKALDKIIGLDPIKRQIEDLKKYLQFKSKIDNEGIKLPSQSLHMLFLGNAGCGKTTVARIIAQILYEIGICKENKLIEVSRKDLIAEYIGQTAPKTQAVIEKAMNGVLFIDEAYSLVGKYENDFGHEAVATLIKAMEDNKDKLIVIFAGYPNEMRDFINSNSGIASRIGYTFEFPDYTVDELTEIYKKKLSNFNLTEENINAVKDLIKYFHGIKNAGNGRLIDKIIQNVLIKHSKRPNADLTILTEEDVPTTKELGETLYSEDKFIFPESINEDDLLKTAYHEIGHALISYLINKNSNIDIITIVPEASGTLGYVKYLDEAQIVHVTKQYYLNKICRLLAGRASEELILGKENISSGCSSDIQKATNICYSFANGGFSETFSLLKANSLYSTSQISDLMKDEIKQILDEQYKRAYKLLEPHKDFICNLAQYLLDNKTLTGEEINKIFKANLSN